VILFRVLWQWWQRRRARARGEVPPASPTTAAASSLTLGARSMELELSNVAAIARREYVTRGKTRAFRIVTVVLVLVAFGVSLAPVLIQFLDRGATAARVEVEIGNSAPALDPVATIAAVLNAEAGAGASAASGSGTAGAPAYSVVATTDDAGARARVESGDSAGLLIIGRDPSTKVLAFTFVTKAKAVDRISQFMAGAATELAHLDLLAQSGVPPQTQALLQAPPSYAAQLPNGDPISLSAGSFVNQFATGFVLSIVLFMAIIIYGQWVALSVAEEKSSRVMEVILGAASPFELLTGKVIGVGGLALTQYVIIFIPALFGLVFQGQIAALVLGGSAASVALPQGLSLGLLLLFGVIFVLGFAFYSVLYAGAASLISRTEDIQNIVAPMSIVASAGYLIAVYSTTGLIPQNSKLIDIATYVPFFSPVMILTRVGAGTISAPEVVVGIVVLAVSVPVALWIAARLYAAGVLMYGQRPSIGLLLRVLRGA
jgi:ABC-2 type transport system permease protein